MLIYFYTAPKYKYVPKGYEANKEIGCKPFVTESTLIKTTKLPLCVMNNLVTFVTNTESTSYNGLIESTSSKVDIVSTSIAAKAKSTSYNGTIKSTSSKVDIVSTSIAAKAKPTSYNGLIKSTSSRVDIVSTSIAAKAKPTSYNRLIRSTSSKVDIVSTSIAARAKPTSYNRLIKSTSSKVDIVSTSIVAKAKPTFYNRHIKSTSSKVDIVSTSIAAKAKSTLPSLSIESTPEIIYKRVITTDTKITSTNSKPVSQKEFLNDVLTVHNYYRNLHHVPPLKLSDELNKHAADRAQRINKDESTFSIRPANRYGENVLVLTGTTDVNGKETVDLWAEGSERIKHFSPDIPTHLTQVIWKSTKLLGCAFEVNTVIKRVVIDCLYSPTGNVKTQYKENVSPRSQT